MNKEQILKLMQKHAKYKGCSLTKDEKALDTLLKGLQENGDKYGYMFCPCRVITGDFEKDRLIICPCVYSNMELKRDGQCHCGLFVK